MNKLIFNTVPDSSRISSKFIWTKYIYFDILWCLCFIFFSLLTVHDSLSYKLLCNQNHSMSMSNNERLFSMITNCMPVSNTFLISWWNIDKSLLSMTYVFHWMTWHFALWHQAYRFSSVCHPYCMSYLVTKGFLEIWIDDGKYHLLVIG